MSFHHKMNIILYYNIQHTLKCFVYIAIVVEVDEKMSVKEVSKKYTTMGRNNDVRKAIGLENVKKFNLLVKKNGLL